MQLIHLNFLEQKSPQIRDRKKAQEMGLSADSHQKEAQRWITDGETLQNSSSSHLLCITPATATMMNQSYPPDKSECILIGTKYVTVDFFSDHHPHRLSHVPFSHNILRVPSWRVLPKTQ
ncbi:hypothetical protein YC2023_061045 [Brassica napus]